MKSESETQLRGAIDRTDMDDEVLEKLVDKFISDGFSIPVGPIDMEQMAEILERHPFPEVR